MHVETLTRELSLTDGLYGFLRRRIEFALGRYREVIRRVTVRLHGAPHGRSRGQRQCLLEVELAGQPNLVISQADPDLYRAISQASRRADRQVARRLGRRPPRIGLPHLA